MQAYIEGHQGSTSIMENQMETEREMEWTLGLEYIGVKRGQQHAYSQMRPPIFKLDDTAVAFVTLVVLV